MCPKGSPKAMQRAADKCTGSNYVSCVVPGHSADLCLQAPTGCCTIRKQIGAIRQLLKCSNYSLVLRFA